MNIAPGRSFLHARRVELTPGKPVAEWPPRQCIVSAVQRGNVYYRTLPDGDLWKLPLASFEGVAVKEWI